MFRQRQKQSFITACPIFVSKEQNIDNVVELVTCPSRIDYPPIENFKLQNILNAGVPLEDVNTKLFEKAISVDDILNSSVPPVSETPVSETPVTETSSSEK